MVDITRNITSETDEFILERDCPMGQITFSIFNRWGEIVYSAEIDHTGGRVDFSDYLYNSMTPLDAILEQNEESVFVCMVKAKASNELIDDWVGHIHVLQ